MTNAVPVGHAIAYTTYISITSEVSMVWVMLSLYSLAICSVVIYSLGGCSIYICFISYCSTYSILADSTCSVVCASCAIGVADAPYWPNAPIIRIMRMYPILLALLYLLYIQAVVMGVMDVMSVMSVMFDALLHWAPSWHLASPARMVHHHRLFYSMPTSMHDMDWHYHLAECCSTYCHMGLGSTACFACARMG